MTISLNPRQIEAIAQKIADKLLDAQDEMWTFEMLHEKKGFSKSYIYHHAAELGGVKSGGKWFFSRRNVEALLRNGIV